MSATWTVPGDAVSGIYIAKLVREDGTAGSSHMVFVVRDDDGRSDLLFQTSDTTWQAYNQYGGSSLYTGAPGAGRRLQGELQPPVHDARHLAGGLGLQRRVPDGPLARAQRLQHVATRRASTRDRAGAELLEHRAFLSVGHDEYWSGTQRANVEAARAAGVNLALLQRQRGVLEDPVGGRQPARSSPTRRRTTNGKIDPLPLVWTGTWRDPRFSPPGDGGRPENALTGQLFMVNGRRDDAIRVPAADGKMRFWRNTTIATQAAGATATLPTGTLGYEWDEDPDNGFRPAGRVPALLDDRDRRAGAARTTAPTSAAPPPSTT